MKLLLGAAVSAGILILGARAQGEDARPAAAAEALPRTTNPGDWTRPLGSMPAPPPAAPIPAADAAPAEEPDVVDVHWMALTMWGEARGHGEEGMRAVGHVIQNRLAEGRHGAFVTDTVSEAWQFSCWNPGDPNLAAIMAVDAVPPDSEDGRMWKAARRIAAEILSGRSADPTEGARFYHADTVAPAWSRGIVPVQRIGSHLFFRTVR